MRHVPPQSDPGGCWPKLGRHKTCACAKCGADVITHAHLWLSERKKLAVGTLGGGARTAGVRALRLHATMHGQGQQCSSTATKHTQLAHAARSNCCQSSLHGASKQAHQASHPASPATSLSTPWGPCWHRHGLCSREMRASARQGRRARWHVAGSRQTRCIRNVRGTGTDAALRQAQALKRVQTAACRCGPCTLAGHTRAGRVPKNTVVTQGCAGARACARAARATRARPKLQAQTGSPATREHTARVPGVHTARPHTQHGDQLANPRAKNQTSQHTHPTRTLPIHSSSCKPRFVLLKTATAVLHTTRGTPPHSRAHNVAPTRSRRRTRTRTCTHTELLRAQWQQWRQHRRQTTRKNLHCDDAACSNPDSNAHTCLRHRRPTTPQKEHARNSRTAKPHTHWCVQPLAQALLVVLPAARCQSDGLVKAPTTNTPPPETRASACVLRAHSV
jgi:hypothetical protein